MIKILVDNYLYRQQSSFENNYTERSILIAKEYSEVSLEIDSRFGESSKLSHESLRYRKLALLTILPELVRRDKLCMLTFWANILSLNTQLGVQSLAIVNSSGMDISILVANVFRGTEVSSRVIISSRDYHFRTIRTERTMQKPNIEVASYEEEDVCSADIETMRMEKDFESLVEDFRIKEVVRRIRLVSTQDCQVDWHKI
ncbi:142_t:CDS:2 [Scutellospora calospora]|uniref:142_t:CDS:1 n=1 Tax=Scutellospora calospora TaxID=85575 RepID=A0ACA9KUH4_9GLOM|nr:142_t:CDS:2 [Scutellospora calospora]